MRLKLLLSAVVLSHMDQYYLHDRGHEERLRSHPENTKHVKLSYNRFPSMHLDRVCQKMSVICVIQGFPHGAIY